MNSDNTTKDEGQAIAAVHGPTEPLVRRWLVVEYCGHVLYRGHWFYLRRRRRHRNPDGGWGWLHDDDGLRQIAALLRSLGHACPDGARYSQDLAKWFYRQYPDGLRVVVDRDDRLWPNSPLCVTPHSIPASDPSDP